MLFVPSPRPGEAKFWGMTEEEATPTAEVWPDNMQTVDVFTRCMGQWRVGFGGPYALDYNVFPIVAPSEFHSPEWPDLFSAIRVMETSALEKMAELRGKK